MSESLKQEIRIPIWMFSIMVTIMLAILAFNASYAGTAKQTETNTKSIELLNNQTIRDIENRKADKADVDRIYLKLDKIETLLIDHMNKK